MTGFKLEELSYFKEFENNLCGYAMNGLRFIEEGVDDYWIPSEDGDGAVTILKDSEIRTLRWVATTVEEAKRILERNEFLLGQLSVGDYRRGCIGCPHCGSCPAFMKAYDCAPCAWKAVFAVSHSLPCLSQTFGGYNLDDVFVRYGRNYEYIEPGCQDDDDEDDLVKYRKIINAVFLGGHIEWALMVIGGKIPPVSKPFRRWEAVERDEWRKRVLEAMAKGERRR